MKILYDIRLVAIAAAHLISNSFRSNQFYLYKYSECDNVAYKLQNPRNCDVVGMRRNNEWEIPNFFSAEMDLILLSASNELSSMTPGTRNRIWVIRNECETDGSVVIVSKQFIASRNLVAVL